MARIRTIKPEFWTDEKVVELSPMARLLFIGIWNFCDDDGRMVYSPKRMKMQIFPADVVDVAQLSEELATQDIVTIYTIGKDAYLQVLNFAKHQKIDRRTPSKLPAPPRISPPPPDSPQNPPVGDDQSSNTRRGFVEDSTSSPDGREGNGRDQGKDQNPAATTNPVNQPAKLSTVADEENRAGEMLEADASQTEPPADRFPPFNEEALKPANDAEHRQETPPERIAGQLLHVQLAMIGRNFGLNVSAADPRFLELAHQGTTAETFTAACDAAKQAKKGGSFTIGFVLAILRRWAEEAAAMNVKGAQAQLSVTAMATELGLVAAVGEDKFAFENRVRDRYAHRNDTAAAAAPAPIPLNVAPLPAKTIVSDVNRAALLAQLGELKKGRQA